MSIWDQYPADYRAEEIKSILAAIQSGECSAVVGLSGSGKSNLMGFMANRLSGKPVMFLVDCNRLREHTSDALFRMIRRQLGDSAPSEDEFAALEEALDTHLPNPDDAVCILLDRFDVLNDLTDQAIFSNLRALRDSFKYQLTFITATRRPLEPSSELAELFFGNTTWLGPLSRTNAEWSARQYMQRKGESWDAPAIEKLIDLSWGYPSLLRASCEAYANGAELTLEALRKHPAVQRRVKEFWDDNPPPEALQHSHLENHPLLIGEAPPTFNTDHLTVKEEALFEYLLAHPNQICEKNDLIQAVWPEDQVFSEGIRDDSLAQLVRRLRRKIESDPSHPSHIQTVSGRGYKFKK